MKQNQIIKTDPSPPLGGRGVNFLPVNINIRNRSILLIGGGKVAAHKASILARFTKNITVLSPEFDERFADLPFRYIRKKYEPGDIKDFQLVYICTDNHELNREIKEEAELTGILASVCDAPELCDFTSPAIYRKENLTISIATDAKDVKRSIRIRDRIQELIKQGILDIE